MSRRFEIVSLSNEFFFIEFYLGEDLQKILYRVPWMFGHRPLFMMKWIPNFDSNTQVITYVPIWVRIPSLPFRYWHDEVLARIRNWIRNPITIDKATRKKACMIRTRLFVSILPTSNLPD